MVVSLGFGFKDSVVRKRRDRKRRAIRKIINGLFCLEEAEEKGLEAIDLLELPMSLSLVKLEKDSVCF